MKTPEEIKKALRICATSSLTTLCGQCPYDGTVCYKTKCDDALAYIEQLEIEKQQLELKIIGVMHFVDKFLSKEEKELDEVQRTDIMREKVLRLIEKEA